MKKGVPLPLTHNVNFNRVLHERVLLVAVEMTETPRVEDADRVIVTTLSECIARLELKFGFMQKADAPQGLQVAVARGQIATCNLSQVTYFTGHETIIATPPKNQHGPLAQSALCSDASQRSTARRLFQYSERPSDGDRR